MMNEKKLETDYLSWYDSRSRISLECLLKSIQSRIYECLILLSRLVSLNDKTFEYIAGINGPPPSDGDVLWCGDVERGACLENLSSL
jgi:hypothetical protein